MDKMKGSRRDFDNKRGPDKTAKPISPKKFAKDAEDTMNKAFGDTSKKKKVDEGFLDALIGGPAAAGLKGMFTGKGTRATLEQDLFLKDFIGDAIASLDNGIRGGIVNPTTTGGAQDATQPEQQPAQRQTPATVAGSRPPSAPPGSPRPIAPAGGGSSSATVGGSSPSGPAPKPTTISGRTTQQGTAPTAPQNVKVPGQNVKFNMPNQAGAATSASATAPVKPKAEQEWEARMKQQGLTPDEIERARGPYQARQNRSVKTAAPAQGANYGNLTPDEQQFVANREKEGASPEQISAALAQRKARQNRRPTTKESSTYDRLNKLFESIMEAQGGMSIAKYMESWFNKYMGGVDWQAYGQQLRPLIQQIEDSYSRDKGKRAIRQLAQAAYAVAKTSGVTPDGAKDAEQAASRQSGQTTGGQQAQQGGQTTGGQQAASSVQQPAQAGIDIKAIRSALPNMRMRDLQAIKQLVDAVIASKQQSGKQEPSEPKTQYMDKLAPNARPASKPASPLTAPTLPGGDKPGGITSGGTSFTRESRNRK